MIYKYKERQAIDDALLLRQKLRSLVVKDGVSLGSLSRHNQRCIMRAFGDRPVHVPSLGQKEKPRGANGKFLRADAGAQSACAKTSAPPKAKGSRRESTGSAKTTISASSSARVDRDCVQRAMLNLHGRVDCAMKALKDEDDRKAAADVSRHVRASLDQVARYSGLDETVNTGMEHIVGLSPAEQVRGIGEAVLSGTIGAEQAKEGLVRGAGRLSQRCRPAGGLQWVIRWWPLRGLRATSDRSSWPGHVSDDVDEYGLSVASDKR